MNNPFAPAKPVAKKLKILIYGDAGTGKTRAALTFPNVAVVDAESGTDLYAGRPDVAPFSVLRAKTMTELDAAIQFIRMDNGKSIGTLVVDPITTFFDVFREAERRTLATKKRSEDVDLGFKELARINNRMKALYSTLTGLPVHVVIIAHEAILYETDGGNLKKVGTKPDVDKNVQYMFDFVIRMNADHSGTVIKSRGMELGKNGVLKQVNWAAFEPVSLAFVQGETTRIESDDEAAQRESDAEVARQLIAEFEDKQVVTKFFEYWRGQGLKDAEILAALGVARASQWTGGLEVANRTVSAWIEQRVAESV